MKNGVSVWCIVTTASLAGERLSVHLYEPKKKTSTLGNVLVSFFSL